MNTTLSFQKVTAEEWPRISASFHDLTYEQTLTYAQAAAQRIGATTDFITLSDQAGHLTAAACLRVKRVPGLGRGIAWIAAGPMMHHREQPEIDQDRLDATFAALRAYARKTGHILRLRLPALPFHDVPVIDRSAASAGFHPTDRSRPYRTVIIDCDQDEEILLKAQHGKWRNHLRKALKSDLSLESAPISEASGRFHELYQQVQAAKGFEQPDIPPEFYYPLQGADFSHEVLFAQKDGVDIAGMTIGRTGNFAVYLFGATTDVGRRCNAGHYLMWESILRHRTQGIKWYDLDGIDPDINPTVTEFKQRTGGTDLLAAGPYEYRPAGLGSALIGTAETLHSRLKKARQ